MKTKIKYCIYLLVLSLFIGACATSKPTYLSKDKIRQIKSVTLVFEAQKDKVEIIDVHNVGNDTRDLVEGGGALFGAVGAGLASWLTLTSSPKIITVSDKESESIRTRLDNREAQQIISDEIVRTFREKTSIREYINFESINSIYDNNINPTEYEEKVLADNIVYVRYRYGVGVSKNYPSQPAIIASVEIRNPKTNALVEDVQIRSELDSLYGSLREYPSVEEYSENEARLFKENLRRVAQYIGEQISRLYTYY